MSLNLVGTAKIAKKTGQPSYGSLSRSVRGVPADGGSYRESQAVS